MSSNQQQILRNIDELIAKGKVLPLENYSDTNYELRSDYIAWKASCLSLFMKIFGSDSPFYQKLDYSFNLKNPKAEKEYALKLLESAKEYYQKIQSLGTDKCETLQDIFLELDHLSKTTNEDFENEFWDNYIKYVEDYNSLLDRIQRTGFFRELPPISLVPDGQKAHMHYGFSSAEQAKLREVANSSKLLVTKVKNMLPKKESIQTKDKPLNRIERLCTRFHIVACQIKKRHNDRPTIKVSDEYDVQDLFHALLRIDFDDVRPEIWTPEYAGGASRIDFVLPTENIVIETKMMRDSLTKKKLGEDLLVDIAKYKQFPNCKTLVCFIYDPINMIDNPRGFESDLNKSSSDIAVLALIRPKGE